MTIISTSIIHPSSLPFDDRPTAPKTKVIAVLSIAIACLLAAVVVREHEFVAGLLLVAAAVVSFFAWMLYRRIGFAGNEKLEEADDRRDEYCV